MYVVLKPDPATAQAVGLHRARVGEGHEAPDRPAARRTDGAENFGPLRAPVLRGPRQRRRLARVKSARNAIAAPTETLPLALQVGVSPGARRESPS